MVKKMTGSRFSEEKFYKSQCHKSASPLVLSRRISHSAGADACTVMACMSAIKATIIAELDENGSVVLPGIGLFEKKVQHATLGGVRNVFGKWVAVSPKPLEVHIRFKPFSELEDVLKDKLAHKFPRGSPAPADPPGIRARDIGTDTHATGSDSSSLSKDGGDIDPTTTLRGEVNDASIPPTAFYPEDMAAAGLPNGELPEHPASAARGPRRLLRGSLVSERQ
ncbi:unnamed protein product [Prorocentrum cordatum]|uniref:HU domain-containing protein n=1 Tax=Prorocentrum cordatum TaxID=2364126 RepID=A0ABN9RBK6_9DINO|nr:unnamed protein product [Polarella glacialis]